LLKKFVSNISDVLLKNSKSTLACGRTAACCCIRFMGCSTTKMTFQNKGGPLFLVALQGFATCYVTRSRSIRLKIVVEKTAETLC